MKVQWRNKLWRFGAGAAILYLVTGLLLYVFQEQLLFHPETLPPTHVFNFGQPYTEKNFEVDGRRLNLVQLHPKEKPKGLVLFFHGNRKHVEYYKKYPSLFTANGYAIWMGDYPRFGKSTGSLTEANLYHDALFLYKEAVKEFAPAEIIIYGKSIGTGVASYLASKVACKALVLETPYRSIDALSQHYFPVYPRLLNRFHLPVETYLKEVKAPVAIFHGTDDGVVPYSHGKKMAVDNNLELVTIEGGRHNNLSAYPLFRNKLDSLLE